MRIRDSRYFLIALGLMITYTAYQVIIGTDLTYYCQYVLGDANLVMPLSSAEKICTIIGIALLPMLLPKFGKRNLICFGCLLGIAGQLLFLVNAHSVGLGVVSCIIRGFGIAPFYGVQYSLPGDAIEYGHWKHGVRVEGLMFSSMSMGQKAGSGFTSAIMGAILSMAAFDGMKADVYKRQRFSCRRVSRKPFRRLLCAELFRCPVSGSTSLPSGNS